MTKKLALALAILLPTAAAAAPAGEHVVKGEAAFTRDGSLTQITTSTRKTIVDYSSFDIGRGETVRIDQPSARSMILNHVLSTDPTKIDGVLTSNGQVWIANPVGVFFGDQAIVDVGRLVAAAGTVDAGEFLAGTERFSQLTGRVEVGAGAQIRAADSVLLVGAAVANYGNITAADGMIALVAGGEVRLTRVDGRVIVTADRAIAPDPERWGVVQAGELDAGAVSLTAGDAYSLAINHAGITRAHDIAVAGGEGGVVSVSGALDASDRSAGATGGEIAVTGDYVALRGAQLDASGAAGGGRIRVGGDLRGAGALPNAKQTSVDADSALRADAFATGDGGQIIVWSDEATRFYGALSARGGVAGGDGGFAEISGASLAARGSVDLGASAGSTGTLLYDPKDIVLHAGTLDGSDDPDDSDELLKEDGNGRVKFNTADDLTAPFDVYESELENTDANIVLEATNSISSGETFEVDLDHRSLAMETRNKPGDETGTSLTPGIHLAGVSFATTGGDISLTTGNGSIEIGDLSTHGATDAIGGAGGDVTIRAGGTGSLTVASIDASGGDGTAGRGGDGGVIALEADRDPDADATGAGARVITVNGDLLANGGEGDGAATDDPAEGGSGGRIALSAGVLADEGGSIALGSLAQSVRVEANGGDGTEGGGDASLTAISLAAHGDIDTHAEMQAIGGNTTSATPGGFGGQGGVVSIASETGDVTLNDTGAPIVVVDGGHGQTDTIEISDDGVPQFGGQGGSAGELDVSVAGAGKSIQVLGAVHGVGGNGTLGAGGAGGVVTLTAADGAVTISDVHVEGGSGTGSVTTAQGATTAQGVKGGNGGSVTVIASAGEGQDAAGGGNALLGGSIVSLGGTGVADPDDDIEDTRENHGVAGLVSITSALDVTAAPGAVAPTIQAGTIRVAGRNVFAGGSAPLVLASSGPTGPASFVDSATVTAGDRDETFASTGNADVRLDDALVFDRFEIAERDTRGHVFVRGEDGSALIAEGDGADGTGTEHNIASIDTQGRDTHFTYRLADGGNGPVDQVDFATLVVGGVSFGTSGGTIANARADATAQNGELLLGRIEGSASATDITVHSDPISNLGNLQLFATNIGVAAPGREPLTVVGAGATGAPAVEMTVAGDVDLDAEGTIGLVQLTQRRASGDVEINLPNGAAESEVEIEGTVVDNGSSRVEAARITRVDTTASQTSFLFALAPASPSSEGSTSGEPVLSIASGAVALGGDAVFLSAGNLVLEAGATPAIDANGNAVALVADANGDKAGAVVASGGTDVDDAGPLGVTGEGVGTDTTPLRTRTTGTVVLTGSGGAKDFRVINESGALEIGTVSIDTVLEGAPTTQANSGITATGDVVLDNGSRAIVLGALEQPEDEKLVPHVTSGGSQRYTSDLLISNLQTFRTDADDETSTVTKNAAALVAVGDITFGGDIDTHPDQLAAGEVGSLAVRSGGTIALGGDVGHDAGGTPTIDELVLSDARLTAGSHTITVASADFAAVDGPGSLALRGLRLDPDVESQVTFRDDVGAAAPLASLDADAERIEFGANHETGTRADRIVAGDVALNTANPSTSPVATIVDTAGGLSIASSGDVTMGVGEKLSSTGRLAIRAAGTATLSDLSATQIDVKASQILIQSRAPGPVALPSGALVQDDGVDWVANDITTNVVPRQAGAGPAPTFVLGSGGIQTGGGPVPFDVVRFTPDGDEIRAANFAGADSEGNLILDLVGFGPRAVPDASKDVPRAAPPVLPGLAARPGDEPPSPPRVVAGQEVIAALHCRAASGDVCVPTAVGDDPLATERAHEIVARYRALIGSEEGQQKLRASFAPLAASSAPGAALARDPALGPAREQIGELAVTLAQVELLGLEREQSSAVRRAVADDFAAATGVAGLDGDAVLAAVDASGVAVLP